MKTAILTLGLALLAGCADVQMVPDVDLAQPEPLADAAEPARPAHVRGAIFQAGTFRPLIEDHRARHVGDVVTVQIVEKVSASQSSTSTVDKTNTLDASIKALPGVSSSAAFLGKLGLSANSANNFEGKGKTENSNDFAGTITAVVTRVLPNGHLMISAEKQIGVNANVDVLRFSGQVDPKTIAPGNFVQSTQVANVRIQQRGRGQQAEAQSLGWLSRFFNIFSPI